MTIAIVLDAVGNSLFKIGMQQAGTITINSLSDFFSVAGRVISHWATWVGLFCLAGFFILYTIALSWAPVSVVMPFTAGSFILVILIAFFFLEEYIPLTRWAGVGVTAIGIIIVGRTAK
jgi:drug/metabolite transporter (DMT)-like permease